MSDWTPRPDGWERRRRQALAEKGLEALDRFRSAVMEGARARRRAVAQLIAHAGGDPDAEAPAEVEGEDDEEKWRADVGRLIRRRRATFEAVADDGRSPLTPERRRVLETAGVPPERMEPWPPRHGLEERVAEAERWADVAEEAVP